jgi:SAM-dependent methyltransferase
VSDGYTRFRPRYPRALFEFVASLTPVHRRAWDCGAGSGQATLDLAEWFDEVQGTDVSAEQIARAPAHPKILWHVAAAEAAPLVGGSVDLVAVAQALHWFDHRRFYEEVRRVASATAAITAWSYSAPLMDGAVGTALTQFTRETLGPYWPPERRYVDEAYRTIPFPFERIAAPELELTERWTRGQVLGYVRTWSATSSYIEKHRADPVLGLERQLDDLWPNASNARLIAWPLVILAGMVS